MKNHFQNNTVHVIGKVFALPQLNHELFGENFFSLSVSVKRLSDAQDILPVIFSERLLNPKGLQLNDYISVKGQFRSYNNYQENKNRLILSIFAKDILLIETDKELECKNDIFLKGFLCKKPIYRTTPFGREISDILLAVNRNYNKSDYIPLICWGRNARFAGNLSIGEQIMVWGRIQARKYQKKVTEEEIVEKVAYEVSAAKMELIKQKISDEKPLINN